MHTTARWIAKPLTGAQAINNPVMTYPLPVFVRKSSVESTVERLTSIQSTAERLGTRSKRDTSFLCTLIHIDYQRSREAILIQHMFEGRGNSPAFSTVWLDYTAPDGLQLTAPQTPRPAPTSAGEREDERRMSRGYMQNHHVVVAEGAVNASLIFPMHIGDPAVRDKLRRLSNALPEGGDHNLLLLAPELRDEITALLAVEVEEIH